MRAIVTAFLVTVMSVLVVIPAMADDPATPGPFQEAGRLVDQLAGRLGTFGAEISQYMQQQGRGGMAPRGPMTGMMGDPADRPLITMMLHHRSDLGLSPEQVAR